MRVLYYILLLDVVTPHPHSPEGSHQTNRPRNLHRGERVLRPLLCLLPLHQSSPSCMQSLVFGKPFILNKTRYVLSWLPRVLLLSLGFYLFAVQFYYPMRWYWQHDHDTDYRFKIVGLVISTGGFLFLMRRGYSQSLKYLNIPQLKSPKEHLTALATLIADVPSVLLGIINILLISHSCLTFKYEYSASQRNFLPHIKRLVSASLFFNF